MAVYTELNKPFLKELADDYSLGRITSATAIAQGSINSNYLIDAAKGRFLLRIDEVKSENELKREIEIFCDLFTKPAVEAGLRKFVESKDALPYLP